MLAEDKRILANILRRAEGIGWERPGGGSGARAASRRQRWSAEVSAASHHPFTIRAVPAAERCAPRAGAGPAAEPSVHLGQVSCDRQGTAAPGKKNAPALCASPRDWKTGKNGMWSCVSEQPGFQLIPSEIPVTSPSRSPPRNAWDAKYFCFKTRGAILHPNESQGFGSIGCHAGFPPPNPAGWAVLCCSQLGWT